MTIAGTDGVATRQRWERTPECAAFYDHIFSCDYCVGTNSKYCEPGWALYAAYMVPARAESIMRMPTRFMRANALEATHPRIRDAVEARVRELYAQKRDEQWRDR